MKKLVTVACAIAFAMTARATEESPIDVRLDDCMEKNPSTAGTIECIDTACAAWDRELNEAYKALMKQLPAPQQESLRKAQRQWVEWRDAELEMLDRFLGGLQGTMYLPMRVDDRMQIVKARALTLREYAELLTSGE